jgi:ABC-type Fe3+ transport system permease subunit
MTVLIFAVVVIATLSLFSYFILLTINNFILGYKGITVDKNSPSYKKRKRTLASYAIALSILFIIILGFIK